MTQNSVAMSEAGIPRDGVPASPAVRFVGLSKSYPGVQALSDFDLEVVAGQIHALVGENGAGKSTLLKILTGAQGPSSGYLEIFGERVDFGGPKDAQRRGISAVYQELTIIPTLSATANVFLGREASRQGFLTEGAMRARFKELCAEFEVSVPPGARAGGLSIADQQILEIMRGLEWDARIMVLDEPTATLAAHERELLYKVVRRLSDRGVAVIFISHDLDEVLRLANTVTVLRDGRRVETRSSHSWTKPELVKAMLGRTASMDVPRTRVAGDEVLRVEGLRVPGFIDGADISVRAGEIVGVAGLVGSGRTELLRALAGMDPASTGSLVIQGKRVRWPRSPREAVRAGIGLAPEDRKLQGLVLGMSVFDNVNLPALSSAARAGFLNRRREIGAAQVRAERVALNRTVMARPVRTLSGGNQQKVLIARWIDRGLRVFLVDEPTRGIDVGAKVEVFTLLDWLAAQGLGVIMVSSELEEVVEHSDRVLAVGGGRVAAEFASDGLTVSTVLRALFNVEEL